MNRKVLLSLLILCTFKSFGQERGKFIKDAKTNCQIWDEDYSPQDSVTWVGGCKDGKAEGPGVLNFYNQNNWTARYEGMMQKGTLSGKGKLTFANGIIREGNFINGVLNGAGVVTYDNGNKKLKGNFEQGMLTLDAPYAKHLTRNVIAHTDTAAMYVGDGDAQELFYCALVPDVPLKGALVLLPGTWETVAHTIASTRELCQLAYDNGIAVIVPSINQRLVMTDGALSLLNTFFSNAIERYHLPKAHFILGGWSMGGLFSVRYTELAHEAPAKTVVVPRAAFNVDGPTDIETLYYNFQRSVQQDSFLTEPKYAINEFRKYGGGTPETAREKYIGFSIFSRSEPDGGNARYLKNVPVRVYNDVDVNWWMDRRGRDLYDMNALDQSAMINLLRKGGNDKAEFINAYGKGFRVEGDRHPHSWSIVDAPDCIQSVAS